MNLPGDYVFARTTLTPYQAIKVRLCHLLDDRAQLLHGLAYAHQEGRCLLGRHFDSVQRVGWGCLGAIHFDGFRDGSTDFGEAEGLHEEIGGTPTHTIDNDGRGRINGDAHHTGWIFVIENFR